MAGGRTEEMSTVMDRNSTILHLGRQGVTSSRRSRSGVRVAARNRAPRLCHASDLSRLAGVAVALIGSAGACAQPSASSQVSVAADAGPVGAGAPQVATLFPFCARQDREKIVRLAPEISDASNDDAHAREEVFVVNGGPRKPGPHGLEGTRVELVKRMDLNGDGKPEWIMVAPDLGGQGDSFFLVYFDCGAGTFYPLLAAYAAEYEVSGPTFKGWSLIVLRSHTPKNDPAAVRRTTTTLRFNGTKYE